MFTALLIQALLLPMHILFLHCYSWFLALMFTALLIQEYLLPVAHLIPALLFLAHIFTAFLIQTQMLSTEIEIALSFV
jgi:hypothetical protein